MGGKDQAMPFDSYRDAKRKHGNLESEPECGARHGSDDNTCYLLSEQRYGNVHARSFILQKCGIFDSILTPPAAATIFVGRTNAVTGVPQ